MLELISFVGVDEQTDINALLQFDNVNQRKFEEFDNVPYIEYGFLYSATRALTDDLRYPPLDFIAKNVKILTGMFAATSIHLCGKEAIGAYLSLDPQLHEIIGDSRVQLNFAMKDYNIDMLVDLLLRVSLTHALPLIVQANKSKEAFIATLLKRMKIQKIAGDSMANIDILHDGSGGFGHEIANVIRPYAGIFTGYAGGLKPGNIERILDLIETTIPSYDDKMDTADDEYYLDMESGVRTENRFDLVKCQHVVDEAINYIND